jgi:hypothetical protein
MSLPDFSKGPVFIRSEDNHKFAVSVKPGGTAVTLQAVPVDNWNSPESQWVFEKITESLYKISLFSSSNTLVLTRTADVNSPVTVAASSPTGAGQLWRIEESLNGVWLYCESVNLDLGFPGYIPQADLGLVTTTKHNDHELGDLFTLSAVRDMAANEPAQETAMAAPTATSGAFSVGGPKSPGTSSVSASAPSVPPAAPNTSGPLAPYVIRSADALANGRSSTAFSVGGLPPAGNVTLQLLPSDLISVPFLWVPIPVVGTTYQIVSYMTFGGYRLALTGIPGSSLTVSAVDPNNANQLWDLALDPELNGGVPAGASVRYALHNEGANGATVKRSTLHPVPGSLLELGMDLDPDDHLKPHYYEFVRIDLVLGT